jgi:fumarate reductase flavoprotein subunit
MLHIRKKRFLCILLAVAMIAVSFSGCAKKGENYDVVVVGAGAAGLAAAIEAADAGAKVAVIEKMPMVGGSTILSAGIVYATGSDIQQQAGVQDSVDDLVAYWSERAEGKANEALLRTVAEKSGDTINWLVNDIGVKFASPFPAGTSPVLRGHMADGGGNGIIAPMKTYADSKNVEFILETTATELITNKKGEVTGVKAVDKDDKKLTFNAKAVILATGGFDRNEELMQKYASEAVGESTYVAVGNAGDGLTMAEKINAGIVGNGSVIGFKAVEGELNLESEISSLMWSPYLLVNKEGERFVNESSDYPIIHEALLKQTDLRALLIFDATTYNPLLDQAVEKGEAYVADSLEELAQLSGVNKDAFLETVQEYNQMIDNEEDTLFGKALTGFTRIETPKYYGVKIIAASIGTMTGIQIDTDAHVLDNSGNIIPNLYAAGEVANGEFFYKVYPASGTSIQMSLSLGRIAGVNASNSTEK